MKKSEGATLGAVVMAALFLHPAVNTTSSAHPTGTAPDEVKIAGRATEGIGPWIASCEYWAPERTAPPETKKAKVRVDIQESKNHLSLSSTDEDTTNCGNDPTKKWGFDGIVKKPKITAVIAIITDPIHTNMTLQFDRYIDILIDAAGDNGYASSYYWLPWQQHHRTSSAGDEEEKNNRDEEEREPGLLIFKHVSTRQDETPEEIKKDTDDDLNSALYVFLVGETPTSGINAYQMEKVFQDEEELRGLPNIQFYSSMKDKSRDEINTPTATARHKAKRAKADSKTQKKKEHQLDIIGPISSGGAASLRRALNLELCKDPAISSVEALGLTSTHLALDELNDPRTACNKHPVHYRSFASNSSYDRDILRWRLNRSGSPDVRIALLVEDGTATGDYAAYSLLPAQNSLSAPSPSPISPMLIIRFPRDISLLRNAQMEQQAAGSGSEKEAAPSPYLRLSLRDSNASDSVPDLSPEMSPLSQESQLMAIQHQLIRSRVNYIVISATNVLDTLFLAQFLHRTVPDANLVFEGGDLLMEREIDDVPFIGAVTISPYHLIGLGNNKPGFGGRAFPDGGNQAYYNAVSTILWDGKDRSPLLAGYQNILKPKLPSVEPPLWLTIIGSDGYYPLGAANAIASNNPCILPTASNVKRYGITPVHDVGETCINPKLAAAIPKRPRGPAVAITAVFARINETRIAIRTTYRNSLKLPIHPSLAWHFLCAFIVLLCASHCAAVSFANFWSPFTRELDLTNNDQPFRRSMYINIGSIMLFGTAFIISTPLFPSLIMLESNRYDLAFAAITLLAGLAVLLVAGNKTRPYWRKPKPPVRSNVSPACGCNQNTPTPSESSIAADDRFYYNFFHVVAALTLMTIIVVWTWVLLAGWRGDNATFSGLFFAYRCLTPTSRISPVTPVFLLLFSWYMWSIYQTLRLRFSACNRPMLPGRYRRGLMYVSDYEMQQSNEVVHACLYRNIECLLITREFVQRFYPDEKGKKRARRLLAAGYLILFLMICSFFHVSTVDRILWHTGIWPTPYEFLITALFIPLLLIAVSAGLRMAFVWDAMRRNLLQRLEDYPIRFAFNRIKNPGWVNMLRQSGLREHWRDMARSIESMGQLVKLAPLFENRSLVPEDTGKLTRIYSDLTTEVKALTALIHHEPTPPNAKAPVPCDCSGELDLAAKKKAEEDPDPRPREGLKRMHALEEYYADFAEELIDSVLRPYWTGKRTGLVEGCVGNSDSESKEHPHAHENIDDVPFYIQAAEEFVAIRYVSMIRAVLVNIRYLMFFMSITFAVAIVAWSSYPFQPRQVINWIFTILLVVLGASVIRVFAQMYRDPILSRITHSTPNELGWEFYLRIASFGAIPLLTWIAYQFPSIGGTIFSMFQPAVEVMK